MKLAALTLAMTMTGIAVPAFGADVAMRRVFSCENGDAKMEVYIPEFAVTGRGLANVKFGGQLMGAYSLDLTGAQKGKVLEPVRVSLAPDKKSVIVNQYTRQLPPTLVPIDGGTVSFDRRFAENAKCSPFNQE